MNKAIHAMTTLLILALFTGACSPAVAGQQPSQQIQNTQDPQSIQSDIETAVAQTVEAQNQIATSVAQTMVAQATETPIPTVTLFSLPTVTPFVISTPTIISGNGGGGAPSKAEYSCDVIHQRPYDNQEFLHGQEFDIKWTILNTGTKTWPAGYDLKYLSGPQMTNAGVQELPSMAPGDQFSVVFDAVAPEEPGFHVMTWVVQGQLCYPYIAIIVH